MRRLKKYLVEMLALIALVALLTPGWGAPLGSLYDAACGFWDMAKDDYLSCVAALNQGYPPYPDPSLCVGAKGALARDGGDTSKLRKLCVFRVPDVMTQCAAGQYTQARTTLIGAINGMEDWIGQTESYCWTNKLDCAHVVFWFGGNFVSLADVQWGASFYDSKYHVLGIANDAMWQPEVNWSAVSILAELYNRYDQANVCEGE